MNFAAPMHFADWFARHAVTRPKALAVVTPKTRLTYFEFDRALHVCAWRLAALGIEKGQRVGICIYNQALNCVVIAALNRMGVVSVSLTAVPDVPLAAPPGIGLAHIVIEEPFPGVAPEGALGVTVDWLNEADGRRWNDPGFEDENDVVRIFLTSGTTGKVKGVGQSMRQIEARIFKYAIGNLADGRSGSGVAQIGVRSTAGFRAIFSTFWAGGTSYLGWPERAVPSLIARERIERIEASPAQYQAVVREAEKSRLDLSSLRSAWITGSGAPKSLIQAIRSRLSPMLINIYGSTEVGMMAFGMLRPGLEGVAGVLAPWVEGQAVDESDQPLPANQEGVLRFRSAEMATGYIGDAEASAAHFRDGWFYPGDTGSIGAQGLVTLKGRSLEQINAGGVKIAPEIIEDAVLSFDGIEDCAAFSLPDDMGVERIWTAVVSPRETDLKKLAAHCASKLRSQAPHRIFKLERIPRNENGKILRSELRKLAAREQAAA